MIEQIDITAKYSGYIDRQNEEVERAAHYENMVLPANLDYLAIGALSDEVRQKLDKHRPETLGQASQNSIFVAHMVANSLKHRPPLGMIGRFATIRTGEHRDHIDMKHNGVVPVADLARVYALQGRLGSVNTRARLEDAEARGVISGSGGRDLIAAYDMIQTTRLENQAHLIKAGRKPDNYLSPADLPDLERSHLRDAFVVVRWMQSAAGHGKGMLG